MLTVFTNGVFDILHIGHIRYLQASRMLGDRLVVGINADAYVNKPGRPINTAEIRREMLLALSCVDEVIIFYADTPLALIGSLQPDVVTKGGDYRKEDVVSGGVPVVIIPTVEGYSTTRLLRLQNGGCAKPCVK